MIVNLHPITDALQVAQGLDDASDLCTPDQRALAMRMRVAACFIRGLLSRLEAAEYAARTNVETIRSMQKAADHD